MVFTGDREARNLRLKFFHIDADVCRALQEFRPLAAEHMPSIVSGFYDHLNSVPVLAALVESHTERLTKAVVRHWDTLLSAHFDDEYFDRVRRIGRVHHQIGLEPRWYVGSYNFVLSRLTGIVAAQQDWPPAKVQSMIAAITSAVMLDMELALSVYSEAVIELEHLHQEANIERASREQIARLLSGLPAAVYSGTVSASGEVLGFRFEENVERLSGQTQPEFATWRDWAGLTPVVDEDSYRQHFDELLNRGQASIEYDIRHKDGSLVRCRDEARVVGRRANGEAEIVGYISDITRDHQIRAQAVASAKLATLGEMATGLAHEMNQPITIMSLAAENGAKMLEDRGAEGISYVLDRLRRIKDQAMRARTIVDHLKIFGGQGQDLSVAFKLSDAIGGALSLVGGALRSSGITVVNQVDDTLPQVSGGLVLAEHVVVNLMLNARDAMAKNDADQPREITLRSEVHPAEGTVSLLVEDSGPGIPEGIRERLFEPFFTTKEIGKGTGLGLSICHGIMTSFAGSIAVANRPKGGAAFTVTFREAPESN